MLWDDLELAVSSFIHSLSVVVVLGESSLGTAQVLYIDRIHIFHICPRPDDSSFLPTSTGPVESLSVRECTNTGRVLSVLGTDTVLGIGRQAVQLRP